MRDRLRPKAVLALMAATLISAGLVATQLVSTDGGAAAAAAAAGARDDATTTPIKHLVVIFDENISFDHYFGTYPYAANTDGSSFCPAAGTPGLPGSSQTVDTELAAGLIPATTLGTPITRGGCATYQGVTPNPEAGPNPPVANTAAPNPNAFQPQRLAATQALTCSNNHTYRAEQAAVNGGRMDRFVESTSGTCTSGLPAGAVGMDYFDGNTVTALWNLAQHYAMSDNSWDATFGPSTPGALNLIAGNSYTGSGTIIDDPDPNGDRCGTNAGADSPTIASSQRNIGDVMSHAGVSWGWFQGGFADCHHTTPNVSGAAQVDYSAHHAPFQYFESTANWAHTPPASPAEVGHDGQANHQYDLDSFTDALDGTSGATLPAVSFLKAPQAQDGHPGSSDPLDEQIWLTRTINAIEQSPYWPSTAVIVAYDDSDGWYDHVAPTITNASTASGESAMCAVSGSALQLGGQPLRCGPSQRLPFLVVSPYAKRNYVDHALITQPSILKFVERNWNLPGIGGGSFDASAGSIEGMFDFAHPQQTKVLLDADCNTTDEPAASGSCDNPAFGTVTATPAVDSPIATPPVVSVVRTAVDFPAGAAPTLGQVVDATGATIDKGALEVDLSSVDFAVPGDYAATVTGSYAGIPAETPTRITVHVRPTITLANSHVYYYLGTTPTPSPARVLSAAGAQISADGALAPLDLSGVRFDQPGDYAVTVNGSGNGVAAAPQTLTVTVLPLLQAGASPVSTAGVGTAPLTAAAVSAGDGDRDGGAAATQRQRAGVRPEIAAGRYTPGTVTLALRLAGPGRVSAKATAVVAATPRGRSRTRRVTVGARTVTARRAGALSLRVDLRGRLAALGTRAPARVTVLVTYRPASGKASTSTTTLKIKRVAR